MLLRNSRDAMRIEEEIYLSLIEKNPNCYYLDLGADDGRLTYKLAERVGTKNVFGVDIRVEAVKKLREKSVYGIVGDLEYSLSFKDKTFDIITAKQIIEHLYNTDHFLEEMRRVLKDDGYIILSTNNLASLHLRMELLLGLQPRAMMSSRIKPKQIDDGKLFCEHGHHSLFTYKYLEHVIKKHGFRIIKKGSHTIYPMPEKISHMLTKVFPNIGAYSYFKIRKEL